jgi:glucose-6-phosphate-specific signal transduction histidine kinase
MDNGRPLATPRRLVGLLPGHHAEAGRPPWFARRPQLTVLVAIVLYVGVLGLRFAVDAVVEPITLLFCLPIALLAVAFGLRVGLLAGIAGVALLAGWALIEGAGLSPLGWATRVVPLLLLGVLLGDAADRLRRSEEHRVRLEAAAQRHRDAAELNDSIVQRMVAAKWALESGHYERALEITTETVEVSHELLADLLRDDGSRPRRTSSRRTSD